MSNRPRGLALMTACLLAGCAPLGDPGSGDPVERGCSAIASAIVFSAVLRALFN